MIKLVGFSFTGHFSTGEFKLVILNQDIILGFSIWIVTFQFIRVDIITNRKRKLDLSSIPLFRNGSFFIVFW